MAVKPYSSTTGLGSTTAPSNPWNTSWASAAYNEKPYAALQAKVGPYTDQWMQAANPQAAMGAGWWGGVPSVGNAWTQGEMSNWREGQSAERAALKKQFDQDRVMALSPYATRGGINPEAGWQKQWTDAIAGQGTSDFEKQYNYAKGIAGGLYGGWKDASSQANSLLSMERGLISDADARARAMLEGRIQGENKYQSDLSNWETSQLERYASEEAQRKADIEWNQAQADAAVARQRDEMAWKQGQVAQKAAATQSGISWAQSQAQAAQAANEEAQRRADYGYVAQNPGLYNPMTGYLTNKYAFQAQGAGQPNPWIAS